ncbi:MAG: hypothetical protein ACTSRU_19715 [Candidatus Hodarchaeales archaeon]
MTALTGDIERKEKEGKLLAYPVVAADTIYQGALVKINASGYLAPCAAEASVPFAGVAYERVSNESGANGDKLCRVESKGAHVLVGSGFSQADLGKEVYASDDNTISTVQGANEQAVGVIVEFISATSVRVKIDNHAL